MDALKEEIDFLESQYKDRVCYHGEMHDHAKTGGTSDGTRPLSHWKGAMEALKVDFSAILDHRQVRHMYLPEWEDGLFICGTEPGTTILDSKADVKDIHYNIIVPSPKELEEILNIFPEYEFEGGIEGHFKYPKFTKKRFNELIDKIKSVGGFFVHPHPSHVMKSSDEMDYYFQDETGIEVFYANINNSYADRNYEIWTKILQNNKRVWAIAGGDGHACCSDEALTTIYSKQKSSKAFLEHLRVGDFTCGAVGIKMCIGNTLMGGKCDFTNQILIAGIGDFHKSLLNLEHNYKVVVLDDEGEVLSQTINPQETNYIKLNTQNVKFYRVEVFDETKNLRIAIGNPIWNTLKGY